MHIHTCNCPDVCPTHPFHVQLQRTYLTLGPRLPCTSARNPLVLTSALGPAVLPDVRELFSKLLKPESGNTPVGIAPGHLLLSNREVTSAVASWHPCPLRNRRVYAEAWQWGSRQGPT